MAIKGSFLTDKLGLSTEEETIEHSLSVLPYLRDPKFESGGPDFNIYFYFDMFVIDSLEKIHLI